MSFDSFGLSKEILSSIIKMKFTKPTAVQELAIPKILEGLDLLVEAQTGTGKTASFVIPLLEKLQKKNNGSKTTRVLVVSPTRELAIQTKNVFLKMAQDLTHPINILSIIGGESIEAQNTALEAGVEIIVATPGRLIDLLGRETVCLEDLEILVLDEADKILDQGFAQELDEIVAKLPVKRQNLFFSATYPERVHELIQKISSLTEIIKLDETGPSLENITQRVFEVNRNNRTALLRHFIKEQNWNYVLVFVGSKIAARNLSLKLHKYRINAESLHGDLSQRERNHILENFKERKIEVLISTDIAARGIDIEKLQVVVNFDLPRSTTDYIHRIGRTGRAGEKGLAISFISFEDFDHFKLIEKKAKIKLLRESVEDFKLTGEAPVKLKGQAPIKGKRKSKKDKLREKKALE